MYGVPEFSIFAFPGFNHSLGMEPRQLYQLEGREIVLSARSVTRWELRRGTAAGTSREVRSHLKLVRGKDLLVNQINSHISGAQLRYRDTSGTTSAWATLRVGSRLPAVC